jgi:hypothetical protein
MMAKLTPRTLISIITELEDKIANLISREKVDGIYISELKSEIKDQKDQIKSLKQTIREHHPA